MKTTTSFNQTFKGVTASEAAAVSLILDNSEYDQKITTMNGLVNPKLARLNLEPISATHKAFKW
jgi:hypothetical protein